MLFGPKLRSPEAIRRRRIWRTVAVLAVGLFAGVAAWGGVFLFNHPRFQINAVNVFGAEALSENVVRARVKEALGGSYAGLLLRTNTLFYPKGKIKNALLHDFPRIRTVELERENLNTLRVSLRERTPYALWCGDIVPAFSLPRGTDGKQEDEYGTCYFLDKTGYIFAKAPTFTGTPLARFYGALKRGETVGQQFIPEGDFMALMALLRAFEERGLSVRGLLVVDEAVAELYLDEGIRIIARRKDAPGAIAEAVVAVVRAEQEKDVALTEIEYIDVRFGNKVYVKKRAARKARLYAPQEEERSSQEGGETFAAPGEEAASTTSAAAGNPLAE